MIQENDLKYIRNAREFMLGVLEQQRYIYEFPEEIYNGANITVRKPYRRISDAYRHAIGEYDRARVMTDDEFLALMREEYEEARDDIPVYIEEVRQNDQVLKEIAAKISSWRPVRTELIALKEEALKNIDVLLSSKKFIQECEAILERKFDGSPEAIFNYKKKYIEDRFNALNYAEDQYRQAWFEYRIRESVVNAVLAAFPVEVNT